MRILVPPFAHLERVLRRFRQLQGPRSQEPTGQYVNPGLASTEFSLNLPGNGNRF